RRCDRQSSIRKHWKLLVTTSKARGCRWDSSKGRSRTSSGRTKPPCFVGSTTPPGLEFATYREFASSWAMIHSRCLYRLQTSCEMLAERTGSPKRRLQNGLGSIQPLSENGSRAGRDQIDAP